LFPDLPTWKVAEFATLRDALAVSDSVLSKHLTALEEAEYVTRRKAVHTAGGAPRG